MQIISGMPTGAAFDIGNQAPSGKKPPVVVAKMAAAAGYQHPPASYRRVVAELYHDLLRPTPLPPVRDTHRRSEVFHPRQCVMGRCF